MKAHTGEKTLLVFNIVIGGSSDLGKELQFLLIALLVDH